VDRLTEWLKEPSTITAITGLAGAYGYHIDDGICGQIAGLITLLTMVYNLVRREKR